MWQVQKNKVRADEVKLLLELEDRLELLEIGKDVPEWMAWKELIDKEKMDRVLIARQIKKIKEHISR